MSEKNANRFDLPDEIARHYAVGQEAQRLESGPGRLERARTQELLERYLPPSPADVLEVGGATFARAPDLRAARADRMRRRCLNARHRQVPPLSPHDDVNGPQSQRGPNEEHRDG